MSLKLPARSALEGTEMAKVLGMISLRHSWEKKKNVLDLSVL